MLPFYWLALILGGGLAVFSLLGDFFHTGVDHDHDFGGESDLAGAHDGALDHEASWQLFSLRSLTYFTFAFGAVGVMLTKSDAGSLVAFAAAAGTGVLSAAMSATLFRYLRQTNSGTMERDSTFEGLQGRVVLPLRGGNGKIMVSRGGRDIELLATCFDADATSPETWTDVVVVEIRGGTALVAPMNVGERTDALLPPAAE